MEGFVSIILKAKINYNIYNSIIILTVPIPSIIDPLVFSSNELLNIFKIKFYLKQKEKEELVEKVQSKERESCY